MIVFSINLNTLEILIFQNICSKNKYSTILKIVAIKNKFARGIILQFSLIKTMLDYLKAWVILYKIITNGNYAQLLIILL